MNIEMSKSEAEDARLTAFALGELDADETRSVEAVLEQSAEARESLKEIRSTVALLEVEFSKEPRLSLHESQLEAITGEGKVVRGSFFSHHRHVLSMGAVAACACLFAAVGMKQYLAGLEGRDTAETLNYWAESESQPNSELESEKAPEQTDPASTLRRGVVAAAEPEENDDAIVRRMAQPQADALEQAAGALEDHAAGEGASGGAALADKPRAKVLKSESDSSREQRPARSAPSLRARPPQPELATSDDSDRFGGSPENAGSPNKGVSQLQRATKAKEAKKAPMAELAELAESQEVLEESATTEPSVSSENKRAKHDVAATAAPRSVAKPSAPALGGESRPGGGGKANGLKAKLETQDGGRDRQGTALGRAETGKDLGVRENSPRPLGQEPEDRDLERFIDKARVPDEIDAELERPDPFTAGDSHGALVDNPWTWDDGFSTFAIDVDTGTYPNVRRFLTRQGTLPPKDAVRIEEMINYFGYDYPEPEQGAPFSVSMEVAGCPWAPDHRLVRVGLRGRGVAVIDTDKEGEKGLVRGLGATPVTVAKDVKAQVEFNPTKVSSYRLLGYANRLSPDETMNDPAADAGEIGAGHTVTALYEIVPLAPGAKVAKPVIKDGRYRKAGALVPSDELLALRLNYIRLEDGKPAPPIEVPLVDLGKKWEDSSEDFRFAAAVAGFGMLLRGSDYAGELNYDLVLKLGREGIPQEGGDPRGLRAEFLELVKRAKSY